jgi:hypothetical protein
MSEKSRDSVRRIYAAGIIDNLWSYGFTRWDKDAFQYTCYAAGMPVVAIQYEFKTTGIMKFFSLEDYLIDINHITLGTLIGKVDDALINREQLRVQISNELSEIEAKSERSAKLIFKFIKHRNAKIT